MKRIELLKKAAEYITSHSNGIKPQVLVILGSGLGFLADKTENPTVLPYGDIPGFCVSTVPGHEGKLVLGSFCGVNVAFMQGRLHAYEDYTPQEIAFPVQVLALCGARNMILTNAVGAVNKSYAPGDFVLISDHIRFYGTSPLAGENIPELGERFCDMSYAYEPKIRKKTAEIAKNLGIKCHEGVYFYTQGPQFETPAEIRAIGILGGDVIGMSSVFEVTAAAHAKMRILGLSLVTNMAAGITQGKKTIEEVFGTAAQSQKMFEKLICAVLPEIVKDV